MLQALDLVVFLIVALLLPVCTVVVLPLLMHYQGQTLLRMKHSNLIICTRDVHTGVAQLAPDTSLTPVLPWQQPVPGNSVPSVIKW